MGKGLVSTLMASQGTMAFEGCGCARATKCSYQVCVVDRGVNCGCAPPGSVAVQPPGSVAVHPPGSVAENATHHHEPCVLAELHSLSSVTVARS